MSIHTPIADLSRGVALSGIAGPDGCNVCGSTVYVKGYDCFPCEVAFDAPVRNTGDLAAAIGRVLELQIDAERGQ